MYIEQKAHKNQAEHAQTEQCSDLDIFEMLSNVLVTIGKSQQILQCIRQVLVSDPTFTPMTLFKYLAGSNSSQLSRKNLITFLDQNNLVSNQKQTDDLLKKMFNRYGINSSNGVQYTSYLNFLYPYNSGILRDLLNNKIKKYPQIDKVHKNLRPSQGVITAFLLLLEQEIKVEKRVQIQINDSRFPGRDRLNKAIKSIKKASQKLSTTVTQKSEAYISMLQLRNFIKAFIEVEDHIFLDLGRRLGLTKSGNISIQNLQSILKKVKKVHIQHQPKKTLNQSSQLQRDKQNTEFDKVQAKHAKQLSFKQQLYKQLANTMKTKQPARAKTPRSRSLNRNPHPVQNINGSNKDRTPVKKTFLNADISLSGNNVYGFQNESMLRYQKPMKQVNNRLSHIHQKKQYQLQNPLSKNTQNVNNYSVNSLFAQFIEIFLKGHKEIQKCKSKLGSIASIDYLTLFKTLDNGKGVVDAQSMQKFYTKLSGIPTDYDFQLIIERYAQPEQKWLSYSQFSDIFRCPTTKVDETVDTSLKSSVFHEVNGIRLSPQSIRMLAQIIYLTLDLQHHLKTIIKKFKKNEIQWLFTKINIDSQSKGFINYQELKKYLAQNLNLTISMIDLMSLLKRLDKSKNGVVLKQQFLTG